MSMITVAVSLAIAGGSVAAYGQYQAGKQQAAQAEAQAKSQSAWNMYNAKVADREAQNEERAAKFEVAKQKKLGKRLLASQRSLIGASGVTQEGSPLLFAEDTAVELAREEQNKRLTGERRVAKYKSQSILDVSKAQNALSMGSFAAKGYRKAGLYGAAGTSISGAGTAASMKYKMTDAKTPKV